MSKRKLLANDSGNKRKFVYRFNNVTAKTKLLILPRSLVKSNSRHIDRFGRNCAECINCFLSCHWYMRLKKLMCNGLSFHAERW